MFGRGSFPFRIAINQGLCLCETFKGVNPWEWSFHLQLSSLQGCVFSPQKKKLRCHAPSLESSPLPGGRAPQSLVKELKVKHLISSNLKTLDRYLVLSNQHQTLMSKSCDTLRRFDSYLMCLALVVSIL